MKKKSEIQSATNVFSAKATCKAFDDLNRALRTSKFDFDKFLNTCKFKKIGGWIEMFPTIQYIPDVGLKWEGVPWKRILVSYEFQNLAWMGVIEEMFNLQKLDIVVKLDSTYYARRPWSYIWKAITRLEYCFIGFMRFLKYWGFINGTEEGRCYNAFQRLEYINLAFWRGRGWQKLFRKARAWNR